MRRRTFLIAMPAALMGCASERVWAPTPDVQRAIYRHDGPPALTLFTVVSNHNGTGGHTALLINGSQRVVFDPAGTFKHPALPERNDVVFGMTEKAVAFYKDYHARVSWHVVSQEVAVSHDVAEAALVKAQEYGAVSQAMCAISTSTIVSGLPGFETVRRSWFPLNVMRDFDALAGVKKDTFYDDSPDSNRTIEAPAVL
ncbi:MAG: hypothetical protein AAF748_00470 [Pseudomonadota bacterium]